MRKQTPRRVSGTAHTSGSETTISAPAKSDFSNQLSYATSHHSGKKKGEVKQPRLEIPLGTRKTVIQERTPSVVLLHFRTQRSSHLLLVGRPALGAVSTLKILNFSSE